METRVNSAKDLQSINSSQLTSNEKLVLLEATASRVEY